MPRSLTLAAALAALLPAALMAEPDPAVTRVLHMTASGFMTECQSNAPDCAKDARTIDERLQLETVVRQVNNPSRLPSDYCEPDGVSDEARSGMLVSYLKIHPELAEGSLSVGAQAAFHAAWGPRCAELDRQKAALAQKLEATTVGDYLTLCKLNEAGCSSLTRDAGQELIRRAFRATAEQSAAYDFCYPDLPESDLRAQLARYFGQHPELASHTLIEGERKALNDLWPNKDQC